MKKKMAKKLSLNKLTITTLDNRVQLKVRGGATCTPTCVTNECGTCNTDCGQNTCATCMTDCYPCWTDLPRECTELYTICDKPCVP